MLIFCRCCGKVKLSYEPDNEVFFLDRVNDSFIIISILTLKKLVSVILTDAIFV